jgi:hypothetical protein
MASSADSSLPTAWLAPPPGLLPSNHTVKIEPVPIAISATLALIISAIFIIIFNYGKKQMFLEDRISNNAEGKEMNHYHTDEFASVTEGCTQIQRPPPPRIDKSMISEPTFVPKLRNDSTGEAARRPRLEHAQPAQAAIIERRTTPLPSLHPHKSDLDLYSNLDGNTLNGGVRNSAYYPPRAGSEVSIGSDTVARSGFRDTDRSRVHDLGGDYSFAPGTYVPKHLSGDAY